MVALPVLYAIIRLRPTRVDAQSIYFVQLSVASIVVLVPVVVYYAWAIHVSHMYPPYHVAGAGNWVWESSFETWFKSDYFLPGLSKAAQWLWGIPLLSLACIGLLTDPIENGSARLPWLFHLWLLAAGIFYGFGAQELGRVLNCPEGALILYDM
jgi:hypothetical protein